MGRNYCTYYLFKLSQKEKNRTIILSLELKKLKHREMDLADVPRPGDKSQDSRLGDQGLAMRAFNNDVKLQI